MDLQNVNSLHTAKIVGSYLRHHTVGASELPELITSVHRALSGVGSQAPVEEVLTPAVSVRQSVRHDYVVCLECGYRGKILRRHISSRHGLNPNEYLKRWGLRSDHPLTAPGYSEQRSIVAKERGFGRKPTVEAASAPTPVESAASDADRKIEANSKQKQTTRSRSKSHVVSEPASEPAKARQRRPRSQVTPSQSEPPPALNREPNSVLGNRKTSGARRSRLSAPL
jgi:predicted transcriptional regulator